MNRKLRILLFSTLFPSSVRPTHGVFVETRLRRLIDSGGVDAKVIAPVPWFYSTHTRHGARALMARTPRAEQRNGIDVAHPRYLLPPRVGQNIAPFALALGALPAARRLIREGFDFDLVDAHYYYPDGVAAALLARILGKPLVITARGSDLNVLGQFALPRRLMRWAADRASASIGVCQALVDILRRWNVESSRLHVMRNGVDLERFSPMTPSTARATLGITGSPVLVAVGNLLEVKGVDLVIDAFALVSKRFPEAVLCLVGDGPLRSRLEAQARSLGLAPKIRFAGSVANEDLAAWYSAADVSVLASRSEGWANVLLESMACATPVVATDVGGSAEVVADPVAGALVGQRDANGIASAIERLLDRPPDRAAVRSYAERFSWDSTTQAQLTLFSGIVGAAQVASGEART